MTVIDIEQIIFLIIRDSLVVYCIQVIYGTSDFPFQTCLLHIHLVANVKFVLPLYKIAFLSHYIFTRSPTFNILSFFAFTETFSFASNSFFYFLASFGLSPVALCASLSLHVSQLFQYNLSIVYCGFYCFHRFQFF